MLSKALLLVSAYATLATAICPGFNYAIGNVQPLGSGFNRCQCFLLPCMMF